MFPEQRSGRSSHLLASAAGTNARLGIMMGALLMPMWPSRLASQVTSDAGSALEALRTIATRSSTTAARRTVTFIAAAHGRARAG
jgi:hypothetical protein